MKKLLIFGSAEIASLARYYFSHDSSYEVVAFTVDDEFANKETFEGLPLVPFSIVKDRYPPSEFDMHVALSYQNLNSLREKKYNQAKENGYALASYICSKSVTWPDLQVGENCFILENQTIQPTVVVGDNVMIWSGNHLGHGCQIDDHVYISSHVCLSGHTKVGKRSFLGVNATVKDFTIIGEDCFVAMDASVVRNVEDGSVVLGASGNVLSGDDRRAQKIKRMYFRGS
ncbi:acetyltransferase [Thalassospira sp.]|uniref:acetyltransferase n=1 Tax=Thalassospira sp. TaxID=1912094 RepID=UPI001B0471AF|nr:acetyltransferase [Thalassospira sp.]MBO6805972.1 acetyltransferase [Thalassospira sp.]